MPDFIDTPDDERIAYKMHSAERGPVIIWCGGLKSDMEGGKAVHLHDWAAAQGRSFIRFDYFGHGVSSGAFTDGTISRWASDIVTVADSLAKGQDVILIGSSMGGWASLLAALELGERVVGMMLINPAPDFTEKLVRARWTPEQERELAVGGVVLEPSGYDEPYAYSRILMEDGARRQILDGPINVTCPVQIFQGAEDDVVPPAHSRRLLDALTSKDVIYTLVTGGDHSLSRPEDLRLYEASLSQM